MRLCLAIVLLVLLTATSFTEAARSSTRYRSSRYTSSYRSSYTYRGPLYTRRLTPSLMGSLYFGYVTRYPSYFSYRRAPVGAAGGTCMNYLALDNGSYIGAFSCPFLPDEPSGWTRCCGYESEGFCCDPSYDDSWKFARLSVLAIVLIVGGCLIGVSILGCVVYVGIRKRAMANRTQSETSAVWTGGAQLQQQPYTADARNVGKPLEDSGKRQLEDQHQPPPYPMTGHASAPTPGAVNPGFEPAPYPLYPPPYGAGQFGGTPADR